MEQYEKVIKEYRRKQADLRRQISLLKSGKMGAGGQKIGTDTSATIRRAEEQIADLDRAIARSHGKLHPLDILLSGEDAMSIFPELTRKPPLEVLRAVTDAQIAQIAEAANRYCETDRIGASHIREAIERTKWYWRD